jgi:predicted Zn-dependent protease
MMACLSHSFRKTGSIRRFLSALFAAVLALAPLHAHAQAGNRLVPVRDAEIEDLMRDYATPILKAAGLNPRAVDIVLIRDFGFNAFVANGQRIFLHVGAITESQTPNQLVGVIAHEAGHIAGGHLANLRQRMDEAQTRAIIGMLLGAAAVAAAGSAGGNIGNAAPAAVLAPQEMIRRDMLAYVRAQEQAADQAALRYLTATGQSAQGMLDVFKMLADQSAFISRNVDPYSITHPLPNERIALLERLVAASTNKGKKDAPALQQRHDMARAKINGFLRDRAYIYRTYPLSNTNAPARYARAIAAYRFGDVNAAQSEIDALIATNSGNAYFWELKGQALLEAGRARESVQALRRAVSLKPNSGLIRGLLGQALVANGDNTQAITELRAALGREPEDANAYRQLAMAYGHTGKIAEADLAASQAAFFDGDVQSARELAARAKTRFPQGSPGWLRADDIVTMNGRKQRGN